MAVYVLSWPGLPEIPFYVIDPKSNRLYSAEKPLPAERLDLDVFENRYVKLSRILELFAPNVVSEVHFILENLQKNFNLKPIVRITEKQRKTTSYLPVEVLLAVIVVFPLCVSFQSTKRTLLNYLDHYSESVCMDCGYVRRDCKCDRLKTNAKNTFVGFATTYTEKGIQTDPSLPPMPGMNSTPALSTGAVSAFSTGMQANNQGITMLIPSGVKLPTGMKFPVTPTGSQISPMYYPTNCGSLGANMLDTNTNPFGFLRPPMGANPAHHTPPLMLPQPRSHKRGRPPVSPFPYLYQSTVGYQPGVAFFGSPFGNDCSPGSFSAPPLSMMHMPAFQNLLPPDFSIPGCLPTTVGCGINYMPPVFPSGVNSAPPVTHVVSASTSAGVTSAGDGSSPVISRKRKYSDGEQESGDRNSLKTVAVQTTTKSFIKKCKLKEEKLAEKSDGYGRPTATVTIVNEMKENVESNLADSEFQRESSQLISKLSAAENLSLSPGKMIPYVDFMRRDDQDNGSKRFGGNLWRQLDDSCDDDKPTVSGYDNSIVSFDNSKVSQKREVDNEGKDSAIVVDVLGESPIKKDQDLSQNNDVGNTEMLKNVEDLNVNNSSALEEEGSVHVDEEMENGANEKTKEAGGIIGRGSSIDEHVASDELALEKLNKLLEKEKLPLSTVGANDLDAYADKDVQPTRTSTAGMNSQETRPVIDNENDVFKILPDGIGDDQKVDPTGDISNLDQQNVSLVQGKKAGDAAVDDVPTAAGHSSQTTDGTKKDSISAQPAIRKIYGKFEYVPTREHIFRCLITKCSQSFDTRFAAELHNQVHPEGSENLNHLRCPKCEFTAPFYHWFDLVRHMRQSHQMLMSREPFSCKLCGLVFENEETLTSHIDFHYSNRYKCIHCGLLLLTWGQVKRHLEACADKHKGNLNLGCPYCTFVFHKKNIRNLHLLSHSDVGLACALCQDNAAWADWKTLRKHYQNRHTKVLQGKIAPFRHKLPAKRKPPRCKRCDVEFKSNDLYVAHMTRTHDLVPYTLVECAICGHRFRTERSHEWHVKHVHVEEISCEKCDFLATSKSVLKAHVAEKHSSKQHTCSECEKSFAFYHQLKVHMAHHARHTIYPCQKCDREFSRQNDLRQHLVNDHDDPSDKAPQSCPECEYRCYSRANLNAHIKKLHPELLEDDTATAIGSAAEEEEEGADHCYFTKKTDTDPVVDLTKVRRFGRKKGRQRKTIKYEWDRMKTTDSYLSIEDRRERRRMNRLTKEADDRMKKLKKSTCARTRSYNEHQAIKNGGKLLGVSGRESQLHEGHLRQSETLRAVGMEVSVGEFEAVESIGSGFYSVLPYLDHNYCKFEISGACVGGDRLGVAVPKWGQDGSVVLGAPDVSAFQECETQLLGLTSVPPMRRRGRPPNSTLNRSVVDARRKFTSVLESVSSGVMHSSNFQTIRLTPRIAASSSSSVTVESAAGDDDGLENLSTEIPDFELIAEADLLKNLGSYNIIDELFSMTQSSGVNIAVPEHASRKVPLGDLPTGSAVGFSFQSPRGTGEAAESLANTFSDGLGMDSEAQLSADFDDIELGEDVYSLFLGGNSSTQSSSGAQLENGCDELNKGAVNISVSHSDVVSLTSSPASASYLPNSFSPRSLMSPRRTGNSLVPRTVPGAQNLSRNSSIGAQPPTICTSSAVTEGKPLPNNADRHAIQSCIGSSHTPPPGGATQQPDDGCESKNCTHDGLTLTKKSCIDTNTGPNGDNKNHSTFDSRESETQMGSGEHASEMLQLSSNLSAVTPEAASVDPTPLGHEVHLQSAGNLESECGRNDIHTLGQPTSESSAVAFTFESSSANSSCMDSS